LNAKSEIELLKRNIDYLEKDNKSKSEYSDKLESQLKATKSELPTDKDIRESKILNDGFQMGREFESDGQRSGEAINSPMVDWLRKYLKETPKEQIKKEWEEIQKMDFTGAPTVKEYLNTLTQEPKGSEERSDKLEAFLDYCNVNKAKIIEDYNKSLAQEPKGSEGEKIDITKQVYGPASSKNYFGDERDGNLTN